MKLVTQDGREFELSRGLKLLAHAVHKYTGQREQSYDGSEVTVATFTYGVLREGFKYLEDSEEVARYGVVGEYTTRTGAQRAVDALYEAWENGAEEFKVPQDTFEKSDAEKFHDFCGEHGLTLVMINELGYKPSDISRNLNIWETTDEFERRGILVADPTGNYDIKAFGGAYSTSLKKWQALQKKKKVVEMPKSVRREYRQVRVLRRQLA